MKSYHIHVSLSSVLPTKLQLEFVSSTSMLLVSSTLFRWIWTS